MKCCSKRSVAVVSVLLFAVLLSLSQETLNARDAEFATLTSRWLKPRREKRRRPCPRTLSRLSSSAPVAIVRVSGRLPGLHPIHLYWFRTWMTDSASALLVCPLLAQSGHPKLHRTRPLSG